MFSPGKWSTLTSYKTYHLYKFSDNLRFYIGKKLSLLTNFLDLHRPRIFRQIKVWEILGSYAEFVTVGRSLGQVSRWHQVAPPDTTSLMVSQVGSGGAQVALYTT